MPQLRSRVASSAAQSALAAALRELRETLDVPGVFSAPALAEAEAVLPPTPELDLRDVPFVTLDPTGSRDLDQAFHLSTRGRRFTVRYAIADVPAFVFPGGAIDLTARERGETIYAADGRIPLHPPVLSEERASLLPGRDRPALVWTFTLDEAGAVETFRLEQALIRSRVQLDYVSAQKEIDHDADSPLALLRKIGELRIAQEHARGGASLNLPDEEVVQRENGKYDIERRSPLAVEEWNAQLSLLTGMAAAELMLDAKIGILLTMPQPSVEAFDTFRRQTEALGRPWTAGRYGDYLRSLDRDDVLALPVLQAAAGLFRGAGYTTFDGVLPAATVQAAIAAPYAHATAPLRRLGDRWALTICLALSSGKAVPGWARESLSAVPALLQASGQRASRLEAQTLDRVEAALLAPFVGGIVSATVIELRGESRARVQIAAPAVTTTAPLPPGRKPGDTVELRLIRADIARGELEFSL